jgi:flagellar motor switch protein FliG
MAALAPSPASPTSTATLTPLRKAAIFLATLDQESTAAILQKLSEDEVHQVAREISGLSRISQQERLVVLAEFISTAESREFAAVGGPEATQSLLITAFGPQAGQKLLERLSQSANEEASGIGSLRKVPAEQLAKLIHSEHPQTIALILTSLDPASAARLLNALPAELRSEVVRRAAGLDQISPEVLNRIAKSVNSKLKLVAGPNLRPSGGVRVVADLLNRLDSKLSDEILIAIESRDPQLNGAIRHLMFVFNDLLHVSQASLRALLGRLDKRVLTLALKGANPDLKKHFLSVMSSRAAEMLVEDMQALGPVRIKDVDDAQHQVIALARQMEAEGAITLSSGGAQEFVD